MTVRPVALAWSEQHNPMRPGMKTPPMDKKIVSLVARMNAIGLATRASCQGHGWPLALPPFVAFRCDEKRAACLSRALRADAESVEPRLHWEWRIDAGFDHEHRLFYRLTVSNPRKRWYRWVRAMLDADLIRLPEFVEIAVNNVHRRDAFPFIGTKTSQHRDNDQPHNNELELLFRAPSSERVG